MLKKTTLVLAILYPTIGLSFSVKEHTNTSTGENSFYAASGVGKTKTSLPTPHSDLTGKIHVACSEKQEHWAYLVFSKAPELNNAIKQDGYSSLNLKLRFNKERKSTAYEFKQETNSKALFFANPSYELYEKIASSGFAILEMNLSGFKPTYFKFPLQGSRIALNSILENCGLKKTERKKK